MQKLKLNVGAGPFYLPGYVNLDILNNFVLPSQPPEHKDIVYRGGWDIRKDFGEFKNNEVEVITISHLLYYIEEKHYSYIFKEMYRIICGGGIVRITEENMDQPQELFDKYNMGREAVKTKTTRWLLYKYLKDVGFEPHDISDKTTFYKDDSLIQNYHGDYSQVFCIEGLKT